MSFCLKKRQKLLTDEQWELVEPMVPPRPGDGGIIGADPGHRIGRVSKPFCGFCKPARRGDSCRSSFLRPRPVGGGLNHWEDEGVWLNAWRTLLGALDKEGLLKWDETFLDGSFAPAKKGALPSEKPSGARGQSGWYWSTVKVFRWEFGWKVPLRTKLRLRKPRSKKSRFRNPKAVRDKSRKG